MSATITIPKGYDRAAIYVLAGLDPNTVKTHMMDGELEVLGVTQAKMNTALGNYDHMETLRAKKLVAIQAEQEIRLKESDSALLQAIADGDDLTTIKAKRQALRNIEISIDLDSISTEADLDAFKPTWPIF